MTVFRLLGSLLLAAALVLMPSSAVAYDGPDAEAMVVTDTNPEPCEPFDVIVEGGPSTTEVDLEAEHRAGTLRTWNEDAVAGTAEFTIRLCREGRWVLTAFDQDGEVLGVHAVFVGDGERGDGGAGDDAAGDDAAGGGAARAGTGDSGAGIGLGDTGASSSSLLLGGAGILLLAGGGAALLFSRRRKTQLA